MGIQQHPEDSDWICLEQEKVDVSQTKHDKKILEKSEKPKKHKKKHRKKHILRGLAITLASCVVLYCVLVFSHIPFIEKWRTIYIETAMSTMTHQWLATAFLPQSLIDEVMNHRLQLEMQQQQINSSWDIQENDPKNTTSEKIVVEDTGTETNTIWDEIGETFCKAYPEIDADSFQKYLQTHSRNEVFDENGYLLIDEADFKAKKTGIQTIYGHPVYAIDTRNGIIIVGLEGDSYCGRMAIVKNPNQVRLATSRTLGTSGSYLKEMCQQNNAVLGINASGFSDPNGTGNGGNVFGMVYANHNPVRNILDPSMKVISMGSTNRLNITNTLPNDVRDAMQFMPAFVVNGKQLISGSSGWGLQPRSVIGQTLDGRMLMAVVDGRQPGHSIGITLGDLTDILYQYGAYQACNLDGGSSAIMYYRGRNITRSSSVTPEKGRHIPNAWIVEQN